MMSEAHRKPLQVHKNPTSAEEEEGNSTHHDAKKRRAEELIKVLTFQLSHSPVQVQVLSNQTVFTLVDIICQETTVGMNESVYEHMWDVIVPGRGTYNSSNEYVDSMGADDFWFDNDGGDGRKPFKASQTKLSDLSLDLETVLQLKYDYGSTSYYSIKLVEESPYNGNKASPDDDMFPRRKPIEAPARLVEFKTDQVDLNVMFPTFNKWITEAEQLKLNLFQASRKHNHGLQERGNAGVRHMMFLPEKAGTDLADYLFTFNYASQFEYKRDYEGGYPYYNWYSMVVFPANGSIEKYVKYKQRQSVGHYEAKMVAPSNCEDLASLNSVFPNLAALAGYKKSGGSVRKGWITYKDSTLRICAGEAAPAPKGRKPPKFTAFVGLDQHEPEGPESIVAEIQVEIQSLHHLFCVVEGLLMSVYP